jgi:two-component system NtrC family sensor kinase
VLAAAALVLGVAAVVLLYDVLDPRYAAIYISVLIGVDVVVLVAYVAYQVNAVIERPLRQAIDAAEAIADGDLDRRIPPAASVEFADLATSINRMTDRLIEDRVHLVRVEKMASIGRLAAGIAHEVGNPLAAITGYTHLLGDVQSPRAKEALAGLERESERIDRIIRGLLDYARPTPRTSGRVEVNDVARTVIDLLMNQGVLKTIDFHFSPAKVPPHVTADRHDMEQLLVNLLLNAVDAMQGKGSLSISLRTWTREKMLAGGRRDTDPATQQGSKPGPRAVRWLSAAKAREVVMIAVADSGPGIPDADVEKVFEPFYTTKDPGKGTGLGLAIVARSVENAGGTIWVSRSREGGAAFRALFPVAAP